MTIYFIMYCYYKRSSDLNYLLHHQGMPSVTMTTFPSPHQMLTMKILATAVLKDTTVAGGTKAALGPDLLDCTVNM